MRTAAVNALLPPVCQVKTLRSKDVKFPSQVTARPVDDADKEELTAYVSEYCEVFGHDMNEVLNAPFTVVTPDSKNPYKQMYVTN